MDDRLNNPTEEDLQQFLEIVEMLSIWKRFPAPGRERISLAVALYRWCRGKIERAEWLTKNYMDNLDEYPGPKTLRQIIQNQFEPTGIYAPYKGTPELSSADETARLMKMTAPYRDPFAHLNQQAPPKPTPVYKCTPCQDSGWVQASQSYCNCDLGRALATRSTESHPAQHVSEQPDKTQEKLADIMKDYTGGSDEVQ